MEIEIEELDPEWTVWAMCPDKACRAVTHSCCSMHLRLGIADHIAESHHKVPAVQN